MLLIREHSFNDVKGTSILITSTEYIISRKRFNVLDIKVDTYVFVYMQFTLSFYQEILLSFLFYLILYFLYLQVLTLDNFVKESIILAYR